MRYRAILCAAVASGSLLLGNVAQAAPIELVTNGGFEAGTFAGWTVTDLAGGSGSWFIDAPGTATPLSGFPTAANALGGSFYAVADQGGPGTHSLTQTIVVPASQSVMLSFDMFVNDQSGSGPLGTVLNHGVSPSQFGTVDVLTAAAGAFDTGAGVVTNLYFGVDPGANPNPYTSYLFDITPFVGAGGTFQLRFAEVDNQLFFNMGVDNVSVLATPVPEPASWLLLGTGIAAAASRRRSVLWLQRFHRVNRSAE